MQQFDNTTNLKAFLFALLAAMTFLCAACTAKESGKNEETDKTVTETADGQTENDEDVIYDTSAATVHLGDPEPISEDEAAAVAEYLFSQLGGNHPEEEQFSFSFPIKGIVSLEDGNYYLGAWEMRLYNEMGEESSSQVIMDFIMPTDYSQMYEIFGENGEYNVYMRDVLHQN